MKKLSGDICVVGCGQLAALLCCSFHRANRVWLLLRDRHYEEMGQSSFSLEGASKASSEAQGRQTIGPYDMPQIPPGTPVFICVDASNLDQLLNEIKDYCRPDLPLILCSKGLGIYLQAAESIGRKAPMFRLLLQCHSLESAAARFRIFGDLDAYFASPLEHQKIGLELKSLFEASGFNISLMRNIATAEWHQAFHDIQLTSLLLDGNREEIETLGREIVEVSEVEGFDLTKAANGNANNLDLLKSCKEFSLSVKLRELYLKHPQFTLGRFLGIAKGYGIKVPRCEALYAKTLMN